jgi:spoIIIJ-associated protein
VAVDGKVDEEAHVSRTTEAQGATIDEALVAAIAELAGCDQEKVELRLRAPGLDDVSGRIRLDLRVESPVEESTATEAESEAGPTGDASQDRAPREDGDGGESEGISVEELDEEADAAADFLEGLLDAMDLPGDLKIRVHEDHAEVEILEIGSGALIGRRGQTLEAVQELLRCALQREFQRRCRIKVDAEGYRARRLEKLVEKAEEAIDDVLDTGEPVRLEPMDVFERKAVHQLVTDQDGVVSRSQGREPARRVIIELDE